MIPPWSKEKFCVLYPVKNIHDVADRFRRNAAQLRASVIHKRFMFPWQRDHKLIEASVWEDAARVIDNTIIVGEDNEGYN